jgi:hypothetical protein
MKKNLDGFAGGKSRRNARVVVGDVDGGRGRGGGGGRQSGWLVGTIDHDGRWLGLID